VSLEEIQHQARKIIKAAVGQSVTLSQPEVVKDSARSLVLRCRAEEMPDGQGSVIIRQIRSDAARGFSDWAGLRFLSGIPGADGLAPRFIGGNEAARLFVMEDLGDGGTLQQSLEQGSPANVQLSLNSLATQMARLHASTANELGAFEELRQSLPEGDGLGRHEEARRWLAGSGKVNGWFAAVGLEPPAGLDPAMRHIAAIYAEPDDFLAFTHGDPAPSNNHFSSSGTHLLDFEYCSLRHALYDITAWNILCPLPTEAVAGMVVGFRSELAAQFPAARDDVRFAEAWACICAYRALAVLTWIPSAVITGNRPWVGRWTAREAVLVILSRLLDATAAASALGPVHDAARILLRELRLRWPAYGDVEALLPFRVMEDTEDAAT
jgi:hypothetical protein